MKFDNFVKYVGADGIILETSVNDKWLFCGSVGMLIPENRNVCGRIETMPEYIENLIDCDCEPVELVEAVLPKPDSKPSELLRVFEGKNTIINIRNKTFGFIEKSNRTFGAAFTKEGEINSALLVTDDYSENDFEIKMIAFNIEK